MSIFFRVLCFCVNFWYKNDFYKIEYVVDIFLFEMFYIKIFFSIEVDGNFEMVYFLIVNKIYNDLLRKVVFRFVVLIVL